MKLALKKKTLTFIFIMVSLIVTAGIFIGISITRDLPHATPGPAAERLTNKIENYINLTAWKDMQAISFRFLPADRFHLYDRKRRLALVEFLTSDAKGENQPVEEASIKVWFKLDGMEGIVEKDGKEVSDEQEKQSLIRKAYEAHINDIFWLNPFATLRAPGAVRRLSDDGGLLVTYESGGVTPGDSYLIYADDNGKPEKWLLWTQAIPARGIEFTFEDWTEFSNGLRLSRLHSSFLRDVTTDEIQVFPSFPPQGQSDPFAPLLERIAKKKETSVED
ncbi:MAG: hypothetical protein KDK37_09475 [Leptospiraceae bacterium]|nr:hypothetical protein [Leptospiraceae bacterium]MCB1304497.1 hypothetical protein [Leptospiraceae bacterium]